MERDIRLRLFADYFHIVLADDASRNSLENSWTDQACSDRIAAAGDICGVRTEVNVDVAVEVHVVQEAPSPDTSAFDHVAEASLRVPSGSLVVMGSTDYLPDAARVPVTPGWVRIRAGKHNLEKAVEAYIDSDESPETIERIRIDIWPEEFSPPRVVKRWSSS